MDKVVLKENDLSRLKKYELRFLTTESCVYYYKNGQLIKKILRNTDSNIDEKIDTIEALNESGLKGLKCLVLPDKLVFQGGKCIGFTIDEVIDAKNVGVLLNSNIPSDVKISILKKIGYLLKLINRCEPRFSFTDLNEYNILLDGDNQIKFVDLDSSNIDSKYARSSFYLSTDEKLLDVKKYHFNRRGEVYGDKNSDLYCYIAMIFNTLLGININELDYDDFYRYLAFLEDNGINKDLLKMFSNIYCRRDNDNPEEYLDDLNKSIETVKYKEFIKSKKKL